MSYKTYKTILLLTIFRLLKQRIFKQERRFRKTVLSTNVKCSKQAGYGNVLTELIN